MRVLLPLGVVALAVSLAAAPAKGQYGGSSASPYAPGAEASPYRGSSRAQDEQRQRQLIEQGEQRMRQMRAAEAEAERQRAAELQEERRAEAERRRRIAEDEAAFQRQLQGLATALQRRSPAVGHGSFAAREEGEQEVASRVAAQCRATCAQYEARARAEPGMLASHQATACTAACYYNSLPPNWPDRDRFRQIALDSNQRIQELQSSAPTFDFSSRPPPRRAAAPSTATPVRRPDCNLTGNAGPTQGRCAD
jgi:broad specificity phosphatase PhoE